MNFKKAVALAILSLSIIAPALAEAPPVGSMFCYHGDGSTSSRSAAYASAYRGGILYGSEPGAFLTTEQCIAHLPPGPAVTGTLSGFIYCTGDPALGYVYYGNAASAALAVGVWTWVEAETGDVYVASIPCELHIGFVLDDEK